MFHLLLIDVAACVALIMVAAFVMVRRWLRRTGRSLIPARWRRRAVAGRAGRGLPSRPVAAVVPGFTDGKMRPAPQPQQAAHAHPATQPMPAAMQAEQSTQPMEAVQAQPRRPAQHAMRAEQATRPQQSTQPRGATQAERAAAAEQGARPGGAGDRRRADSSRNGPSAAPRQQPRPARPATSAEQIGNYYDEADRQMADYLAELGWAREPGEQDPH